MKAEIKVCIAVYPGNGAPWVEQSISGDVRESYGDEKMFGVYTVRFDVPAAVEAEIQRVREEAERKILDGTIAADR